MINKNKIIIGIASIFTLIFLYFILTNIKKHFDNFNVLEGNNQILKENNKFYKEQIKQFQKQEDSIKIILNNNKKEIDCLKNKLPFIIKEKEKSKKDIELLLNSQMQQWYDNKVEKLLRQKDK